MAEEKRPGLACLITGVMTWVILMIFKVLVPGYVSWFMVFLPVFTIVMFLIALFNLKEMVLAVTGLLVGAGAVVWFFLG